MSSQFSTFLFILYIWEFFFNFSQTLFIIVQFLKSFYGNSFILAWTKLKQLYQNQIGLQTS